MRLLILYLKEEFITFYQYALSKKQSLQKQIKQLKQKISKLPDGKIICSHDRKRIKWYHSIQNKQIYISKKKLNLAEQLAQKKYLNLLLNAYEKELNAIGYYLRHYDPIHEQEAQNLLTQSEYQPLLSPIFKPLSQELYDWMHEPYETNTNYPEQPMQKAASGTYVRSKSEAIIDMLLHTNNIPFRYECALQLGDRTLYPDFTIRHPVTGELYYWEHFGLIDDPIYRQNALSKIQLYASHGILPGIHLIMTFETKDNPLTYDFVKKTIEQYFF